MRRGHHVDVAVYAQEAPALLAAGVGTVEDRIVLFLQMRRAFQRHGPANVVVCGIDVGLAETEVAKQVESRVVQLFCWDAKDVGAELLAQRPLVEDKTDVEGRGQRRFDLIELILAETMAHSERCG